MRAPPEEGQERTVDADVRQRSKEAGGVTAKSATCDNKEKKITLTVKSASNSFEKGGKVEVNTGIYTSVDGEPFTNPDRGTASKGEYKT